MSSIQKFIANLIKTRNTLIRFADVAVKVKKYGLANELYEEAQTVKIALDYVQQHHKYYSDTGVSNGMGGVSELRARNLIQRLFTHRSNRNTSIPQAENQPPPNL